MNDAAGSLAEGATFCKTGDPFRPGLDNTPDGVGHQICPDDLSAGADEVTDANPQNWYVRVMFDELLDPSIEDLVPILDENGMDTGTAMGTLANTQPFTLQCQSVNGGTLVDIPYDGYYSPAGNKITWPVGPSLVIVPSSPSLVATQSECQLTLKTNIKDEQGNAVPSDQLGPYKFKIAPVQVVAADTTPADGDSVDPIAAGVDITFNTAIDPASTTGLVVFTPDPGNDYAAQETDTEFFFGGDFQTSASYMWTLKQGAMVADQCGKVTTIGATSVDTGDAGSFTTNDLMFTGIAPFDTQMNAKAKDGIHLKFNQYMDPSTLAATEYSITPTVPNLTVTSDTAVTGNLVINGDFAPDTDYVFTLKAGATISDCPGGETGSCVTSTTGGTFTNASDQVVHFHTAATALTSTTPADNGEVDKADATDVLDVVLSFNTKMLPATLLPTEWSISPAIAMTNVTPVAKSSSIILESDAAIPAGDYTFTLKMGATIDQASGGTYTQAADKVIHFTVVDPTPAPTPSPCF